MAETLDMLDLLNAARSSSQLVAWRNGRAVSFAEFLARVRVWRTLLRRNDGRSFAIYFEDSVEFASALFGAWHAGKTIYLPGDCLKGTCIGLRQVVDGFLGEFPAEWLPLAPALLADEIDADGFEPLQADFIGLVLYTSGTTGTAQAIPKKLVQIGRELATLERQFGDLLGTGETIATVSHQHIYGLLFLVLWPLVSGRALHARRYPFIEELVPLMSSREWVLVSSPAHLQRLPENPGWCEAQQRARAVFSSGGPLTFEGAQEANRLLGTVPIEVFGSSETGGIAWRQQRTGGDASWSPFPAVTWRIEPKDGVLEVRSPNLPNGDWFQMADRAESAGTDRFLLKGRIDKITKIEGKRISLTAIEAALKHSLLVTDARVAVVDGARQRIAAFVVLSKSGWHQLAVQGKLPLNRLLRDLLRQSFDPVGLPRIWHYLDALPVNPQGKTTFAELTALLANSGRRPIKPHVRLREKDCYRAVLDLIAPRNLLYFEGHFTGQPILPGVAQVDWVIAYGRQYFDLPPVFRTIHALKFQRVIPPETAVKLELVHEPIKSSLVFKISSQAGAHASGRVVFGAANV